MATKIQPTTEGGGRKPSEETRSKLRAAGQSAWSSLTEEQKAVRLANLAKGRQPKTPAPSTDPPAPTGGPTNPLPDPLGARRASGPRSQGLNGHAAPPVFRVPDMPPLDLSGPGGGDELVGDVDIVGPGIGLSQEQVEQLIAFPFKFVALRRGDHWKLRPDEREMVAEPLTRKLNEHAATARVIAAGGDFLLIIGGLAILIWARLLEDSERAAITAGGARGAVDRPGAGRGAPPADDEPDDLGPGPSVPRPGGGTLNGVRVGAADDGRAAAGAAQAPDRPLVQAL